MEQYLNNSAGKGTNKQKLARNEIGWQLSDSSETSRQKIDVQLPTRVLETELFWRWLELP